MWQEGKRRRSPGNKAPPPSPLRPLPRVRGTALRSSAKSQLLQWKGAESVQTGRRQPVVLPSFSLFLTPNLKSCQMKSIHSTEACRGSQTWAMLSRGNHGKCEKPGLQDASPSASILRVGSQLELCFQVRRNPFLFLAQLCCLLTRARPGFLTQLHFTTEQGFPARGTSGNPLPLQAILHMGDFKSGHGVAAKGREDWS